MDDDKNGYKKTATYGDENTSSSQTCCRRHRATVVRMRERAAEGCMRMRDNWDYEPGSNDERKGVRVGEGDGDEQVHAQRLEAMQ